MEHYILRPSPNFNERPEEPVSVLVLHYTGMQRPGDALDRLTKPDSSVSAHYLVSEEGEVYALVGEEKRAWHAGVSHWRGCENMNDISIGIEIENPGHEWGYRPFPAAQMEAVAELSQGILARHPIPARNVVAHSDIAPERKEDPGELFDWAWLAARGVGMWPLIPSPADGGLESMLSRGGGLSDSLNIREIQHSLQAYGYGVPVTGELCEKTRKVILAFQRHFRPSLLSGEWDGECWALLEALLSAGS